MTEGESVPERESRTMRAFSVLGDVRPSFQLCLVPVNYVGAVPPQVTMSVSRRAPALMGRRAATDLVHTPANSTCWLLSVFTHVPS